MDGRLMVTKSPYPDATHTNTLQLGAEFLDFVMETLQKRGIVLQAYTSTKKQFNIGESLQGWEVKLDASIYKNNRLSIEIAEKSNRSISIWTPSGIYRRDNTWIYIQGNFNGFWWFQKNILIQLHNTNRYEIAEFNGTIRKFYLPVAHANKYGVYFSK